MKQALNIIIILVIAFLFNSCGGETQEPIKSPKELKGTVKDKNGNTYPNSKIIVFNSLQSFQESTNSSGVFEFKINQNGSYKVTLIPPLGTNISSKDPIDIEVNSGVEKTVDFTIQSLPLVARTNIDSIDIFGEIKNQEGTVPLLPNEAIYARNVFDTPIGLLTPIKTPTGHHLSLSEWKTAKGTVEVSCNGNSSNTKISLQGMIPNGTYTLWLNFLNKKKLPGQSVNFGSDVVKVAPLGSGTLNVLKAVNNGNITANIKHPSCILTDEAALILVVDYHLNGKTFGTDHIPDAEDVNHMLIYFQ
ncbi:hypothetical protein SAMN06298216_3774 [Spirosomataceae bacterium TFI 002]|nr:hypothetical protein SAMN06298216_3774 [Spirosomataceae bacterium TFI 002]